MSVLIEKSGLNRRQFLKGAGLLTATVVISGLLAKFGIKAFARSTAYIGQRAAGVYSLDEAMTIRRSHQNPEVLQLYQEFLSPGEVKPLSERAHHLLHTRYGSDIPALIADLKIHALHAA